MRPADRLFRIIQLMRGTGRAMTAAEIAERMEVAPRTIYRDMQHLIASGAPIDGERGVGYLLREAFDAPPLTFTFEQLEALAFGIRATEVLADPRLAQAGREALAKMQALLPPDHAARLATTPLYAHRPAHLAPPPDLLEKARRAIAGQCVVEIAYDSLTGKASKRRVHPVGLHVFGAVWLMSGWCELRQAFRDFRVDRITGFRLTGETFADEPGRTMEDYFEGMRKGEGSET